MPTLRKINDTTWEVTGDTQVRFDNASVMNIDARVSGMLYSDQDKVWRWDPSQQSFVEVVEPTE